MVLKIAQYRNMDSTETVIYSTEVGSVLKTAQDQNMHSIVLYTAPRSEAVVLIGESSRGRWPQRSAALRGVFSQVRESPKSFVHGAETNPEHTP